MAKPRIIIVDENEKYISSLQIKFVTDYFEKVDLEIITNRNYFEEFFSKPQNDVEAPTERGEAPS